MTDTTQEKDLDRIERSIEIDAPVDRVFDLVSRPGWWINEGEVESEPKLSYDGDVAVVVHNQYGEFRIESLASDRPRYVSFRWLDRDDPTAGTTVEFWVTEREATDGDAAGVTLRVLETGFTELGNTHEQVVKHVEENTEGWETELAAAQRFVIERGE